MQRSLVNPQRNNYPKPFEQIWSAYPRRGKTKGSNDNKRSAFRQYQLRLRQGESQDDMLEGAKRYAEYIRAQGAEGTPFVKQCATFLGPDCHFLCEWEAPDKPEPKSDSEWLSLGRELGMEPKAGENWPAFKDRVRERL